MYCDLLCIQSSSGTSLFADFALNISATDNMSTFYVFSTFMFTCHALNDVAKDVGPAECADT